VEAKFGPLDKRIKRTGINRDEILEELKVETVDEKLRRYE
jgi:hypothetical protein